jgi:hypothetical protein
MDELDHKHLVQTHVKVDLLVQQVARLQERLDKTNEKLDRIKLIRNSTHWGRKYLRKMLRDKRAENAQLKLYNRQLENELRLRGLE